MSEKNSFVSQMVYVQIYICSWDHHSRKMFMCVP